MKILFLTTINNNISQCNMFIRSTMSNCYRINLINDNVLVLEIFQILFFL